MRGGGVRDGKGSTIRWTIHCADNIELGGKGVRLSTTFTQTPVMGEIGHHG